MLVFVCLALPLYREIDYGYSNNVEATLCTGNCSSGKCIYFIMHVFIFFCIDHYGYLKRSIYKAKIAQTQMCYTNPHFCCSTYLP